MINYGLRLRLDLRSHDAIVFVSDVRKICISRTITHSRSFLNILVAAVCQHNYR